ncbi:MAG: DUF2029 domain-containing protein [Chloroflexia bacterium]|nr:DUF2029 domain-containing protein [Chloroflexia bacterium]
MSNDRTQAASIPPSIEGNPSEPTEQSAIAIATRSGLSDAWHVVILATMAVVSSTGWYGLYRWYGLVENRNQAHFGFDKIAGWFDSPVIRQTALIFLVIAGAYAVTIWSLRSLRSITGPVRLVVLLLIAGPVVANVALYPVGALDVFNYLIELKLAFHYDQNPYLVTFEAYQADSFAKSAFLIDIPLFYGPAWLLVSWIPLAVTGYDDVITALFALKLLNVTLLAITALLIAAYQRDARSRWIAAVAFLANPLVLFEGVANAHNDVLLGAFLLGAMLALQRKSPLAGPLLALSALVKLYTVVLVPLFIVAALKDRWGWRRAALTSVLATLTVAVVSAGYWGDGELVEGLRTGLEQSQEMDHVSPYSLAQQFAQEREADGNLNAEFLRSRPSVEIVPEAIQERLRFGFAAVFTVAALLIAASIWKGRAPEQAAAETLLLMMLLLTNLYGWYLIPVFALLALRLDRLNRGYIATATALGLVYYPMFVYAHFNTEWTRFQVHLFLALFLTVPILLYLAARSWAGFMDHREKKASGDPSATGATGSGAPI